MGKVIPFVPRKKDEKPVPKIIPVEGPVEVEKVEVIQPREGVHEDQV